MCGIFVAIAKKNKRFSEDEKKDFIAGTKRAEHRGPDAIGYRCIDIDSGTLNDKDFNVFLGHTRLSIIDTSHQSNQPMKSDRNNWIVHNGEIYNYIELREDLKKRGQTFKTESDTELILKLYENETEAQFNKMNGMWGFVIADCQKKRIVISRDRFSIKPLHYIENDEFILIASEIKQLIPFLKKKQVQTQVMLNFLQLGAHSYSEDTFFEGIKRVNARTNWVINLNSGKQHKSQYWEFQRLAINDPSEEVEAQFLELFEDSVRLRLRSDVPVGGLLSGGLDSSSIAVLANKESKKGFHTFSVISNSKQFSEEKYIDEIVTAENLRNTKVLLDERQMQESIQTVLNAFDEPFTTFSCVALYKMYERIKQETDLKVILSGQGADELLCGYLKYYFFYLKQLAKKGSGFTLLKNLIAAIANQTVIKEFKLEAAKRYIPMLQKKPMTYITIKGDLEKIWECHSVEERQIRDIEKYSVPVLAFHDDRAAMAHSIETRYPFLDYRLIEYALNIKMSEKINKGWTKYILRKTMNRLPQNIRWRKDKKGFTTPEEKWIKGPWRDAIRSAFKESALHDHGIIDSERFIHNYDNYISGKSELSYFEIMRTFTAELWAKKL